MKLRTKQQIFLLAIAGIAIVVFVPELLSVHKPKVLTSIRQEQIEEMQRIDEAIGQATVLRQQSQYSKALSVLQVRAASPVLVFRLIQLRQQLASDLFEQAQGEYRKGKISEAIAIADSIPSGAPVLAQYQKVRADWQQSQTVLNLARALLSQGDSVLAFQALKQIKDLNLLMSEPVRALRAEIGEIPTHTESIAAIQQRPEPIPQSRQLRAEVVAIAPKRRAPESAEYTEAYPAGSRAADLAPIPQKYPASTSSKLFEQVFQAPLRGFSNFEF